MSSVRERYGEAFWRAHHEAWLQSELNQREYCEAYEVPLKAFDKCLAELKPVAPTPARKVLYRRGGLSHTLEAKVPHPLVTVARHLLEYVVVGREGRFSAKFY